MNEPCRVIETALVAAGVHQVLPDWDSRQRGRALLRDMAALDVPPSGMPVPAIDRDHGSIFGWCYVLEGSRIGARTLFLSGASELRFRCDRGDRISPSWREGEFMAQLQARPGADR